MEPFAYDQLGGRVVFGNGRVAEVGIEAVRLGANRVMLISDAAAVTIADGIAAQLAGRLALRWDEVVQHVPFELAERARAAALDHGADVLVCVGGGSSTGLAKAIALTGGQPIVAVPTTYAGSEQTSIYGLTGDRHKQTGKDPVVKPQVVVYDPELTVGLPTFVTGPSAFNALAHSVEALYAPGCNPVVTVLALEGVRAIARSLAAVMADPTDLTARGDLLYGAYLSGVSLGSTAAGFHHKICHVLGGMFDLVHADAHSVVLPHAVAFNAPAIPAEAARLAESLGAPGGDPAAALWDLAIASNVPTRLADLKGRDGPLRRDDLAAVAEQVAADVAALAPPGNPRPVSAADVLGVLERAFDGVRPSTDLGSDHLGEGRVP
jgi:maleylacetate reductase